MFNLLDERSLADALKLNKIADKLEGRDPSSILDTVKIYEELQVDLQLMQFSEDGFLEINTRDGSEHLPIINVIKIAEKLIDLKNFKNFDSLRIGFNNPGQFTSTMFEVDCAHETLKAFRAKDIEFAPNVKVGQKTKNPDFRAVLQDGTVVTCECKSLSSIHRAKRSRSFRFMEIIEPQLRNLLDENFRIEISFKALPSHWNRNLSDQLIGGIRVLMERKLTDKHIELVFPNKLRVWIKLCAVNDPVYFQSVINVGNAPEKNSPTLIVGEIPNLRRDIKDIIKDAMTQLPRDSYTLIWIYSLNHTYASQAIEDFFSSTKFDKLTGVASWTDKLRIHSNHKFNLKITNYLRAAC